MGSEPEIRSEHLRFTGKEEGFVVEELLPVPGRGELWIQIGFVTREDVKRWVEDCVPYPTSRDTITWKTACHARELIPLVHRVATAIGLPPPYRLTQSR
ncbi:MAG: hypothetical protein QXI37_02220 [Thermoprotei archaeon]